MLLPITLTTAAGAAIGNLILAYSIVRVRMKDKILLGDGGQPLLLARTRAQANFAEYAPFVLILMGLIEAGGGASRWLMIAGALFAVARIAHAIGMERPTANPWRAGGAVGTWAILLWLAVWALVLAYSGGTPAAVPVMPLDGAPTA